MDRGVSDASGHESEDDLFPGSKVAFGARVGSCEQAAAALAEMAFGDATIQDAILTSNGLPPLLSLVQAGVGSALAAECAVRVVWCLGGGV